MWNSLEEEVNFTLTPQVQWETQLELRRVLPQDEGHPVMKSIKHGGRRTLRSGPDLIQIEALVWHLKQGL